MMTISPIMELEELNDIFLLDNISDEYMNSHYNYYSYNDRFVPRVSNILRDCINKEYLVNWAASIGYKRMNLEREKATTIGSKVHEMIEHFLLTGEDLEIENKYFMIKENILTAYNNFKSWKEYINSLGVQIEEVIAVERQVVTPFYGGTLDLILRINGRNYIVDLKISSKITYEYIIQTCAYMFGINKGLCLDKSLPHIDGIGIIRIDKKIKGKFEDLFLNEFDENQSKIINSYFNGFLSLLCYYYNNINMSLYFDLYKDEYSTKNYFLGG